MERYIIAGITYSTNEVLVTFANLADTLNILRDIAGANIKIDMIYGLSIVISGFDINLVKKDT